MKGKKKNQIPTEKHLLLVVSCSDCTSCPFQARIVSIQRPKHPNLQNQSKPSAKPAEPNSHYTFPHDSSLQSSLQSSPIEPPTLACYTIASIHAQQQNEGYNVPVMSRRNSEFQLPVAVPLRNPNQFNKSAARRIPLTASFATAKKWLRKNLPTLAHCERAATVTLSLATNAT